LKEKENIELFGLLYPSFVLVRIKIILNKLFSTDPTIYNKLNAGRGSHM